VSAEEVRSTLEVASGSRVVLWGDSLASEAGQPFLDSLRFWTSGRIATESYGFELEANWRNKGFCTIAL
jgi:hypothetical protein